MRKERSREKEGANPPDHTTMKRQESDGADYPRCFPTGTRWRRNGGGGGVVEYTEAVGSAGFPFTYAMKGRGETTTTTTAAATITKK